MQANKFPIISAKFKVPSPRARYVLREALSLKLEQMKHYRLTIIKAGAGSGKTTLVSIFMKEKKIPCMKWITMDESLNQVFLFWRYLLEAFQNFIGDDFDSLRNCFDGNIQKEMLSQLIPFLADKLNNAPELYLVLDDFQTIQDNFLMESLNQLIRYLPDQIHIVILTRQMPSMDIGSLYMEDGLLLIEEEEMRFTNDECREFLVHTLKMNLKSEEVENIIFNANGWVGGAQLMAIAGGRSQNLYSTTNEQVIYDYIKKEIFQVLSDEEQLFLEKTAVLSYFNEEICSKYLPEYNFGHMMQMIMDKNLFVIQMDEDKNEYRYHAILKEFLLHELEQKEETKIKLSVKAADIFFQLQDYDECVRLLFLSKDYENLMQKLLVMPQNVITFSYMMQVPLEQISKNVNFAYQYFYCYYASMDLKQCQIIYHYIQDHFKEDETFRGFKHSNLFFDVHWEYRKVAILSLEQIQDMPLAPVTKAYLLIKEAYFLFVNEQVDNALDYLNHAEVIYHETKNIYIESFVLLEKTQILEEYGKFFEALALYKEMKEIMVDVPSIKASYYIGIAGLHIRQKKMKKAKEELDQVKSCVDQQIESIYCAYLYTLAEWYYIMGESEKTENIILSLSKEDMYHNLFLSARLLRYPIYYGKNKKLAKYFLEMYENADEESINFDTKLLYAQIVYGLVDKQKGVVLLNDLMAHVRKIGNKLKIIECSLFKARCLYEQGGQVKRVVNLVLEALSYAQQEEIVIPFWFEKESLIQILHDNKVELEETLESDQFMFLDAALEVCDSSDEDFESNNELDQLSEREKQVLDELSKGYSNKEIAEHLCITLATVKTHIINIYSKLGVNNRMAAVNKMKE